MVRDKLFVDGRLYEHTSIQDDWNVAGANKLHYVKPVLGDWQSSYKRCRKDEVVLCRARIGQSHLTHSYILRKDPPPQCEHCQCILTVRHILVECNNFSRGARCSSVVRAFAHGAMGRRIDPSWGEPTELFLVPASAPRLV